MTPLPTPEASSSPPTAAHARMPPETPSPLPPATRMGAVTLRVRDLDVVSRYYQEVVGLRVLRREGGAVFLGASEELLRLVGDADASARPRGSPGLFHVAYLLPDRQSLASLVRRYIAEKTPIEGASDHLVSEALYLSDPEGNGIEIYADRPRAAWRWTGGRLEMATMPLDVRALLAEPEAPWRGAPEGTTVGHVHLQVAHVPPAESFYRAVGFDLTTRYGADASFLSAGGYHHHLAVNAWGTRPGLEAPPGTLGLDAYEVVLPSQAEVDTLSAGLAASSIPHDASKGIVRARDPSGNLLVVRAA